MKALWLLEICSYGILLSTTTSAATTYTYPYNDPLYATVSSAIMKGDDRDFSVKSREIRIPGLAERNTNQFFGKEKNFLALRLWAQEKKAPIIIMVSGLGGDSSVPYYNYLAYHFYKLGFHALVIPSPFFWQFAFSSSNSGYPGVTKEDAKDLYLVMKKSLETLAKDGVQVSDKALLGVSMGALESAYVYSLDQQKKEINFKKTLLVNPPYSMIFGVNKLDELYLNRQYFSDHRRKEVKRELFLFALNTITFQDINSPNYFLNIENRLPLNQQELSYAIGHSMREFLGKMIFATQEVVDIGVLGPKSGPRWVEKRKERSEDINFHDYLKLVLLPFLEKNNMHYADLNSLERDTGLEGVLPNLVNNPDVKILHNVDDFVLSSEHIKKITTLCPTNTIIYPKGGHIGNLWFEENRKMILRYFLSLVEKPQLHY